MTKVAASKESLKNMTVKLSNVASCLILVVIPSSMSTFYKGKQQWL